MFTLPLNFLPNHCVSVIMCNNAVSTPGRQKLKESKSRGQFLDDIWEGIIRED
jgi:hypothetical protein